jgi:hypothetical protein
MGGRPRKEPKGLEENHKVSEEPQGYSGNLSKAQKPVYVSVPVPVSDSGNGSVCEIEGVSREGNTHTPPTLEAVEAEYNRLCSEHKVTPIPCEAERLFSEYLHRSKSWKSKLSDYVAEDIKQGKKYAGSKKRKSGFVNYDGQRDPNEYKDAFYKVEQEIYTQ